MHLFQPAAPVRLNADRIFRQAIIMECKFLGQPPGSQRAFAFAFARKPVHVWKFQRVEQQTGRTEIGFGFACHAGTMFGPFMLQQPDGRRHANILGDNLARQRLRLPAPLRMV